MGNKSVDNSLWWSTLKRHAEDVISFLSKPDRIPFVYLVIILALMDLIAWLLSYAYISLILQPLLPNLSRFLTIKAGGKLWI